MTPVNSSTSQFIQANDAVTKVTYHVVSLTTKATMAGAGLSRSFSGGAVAGIAYDANKRYQKIKN